MVNIFYDQEYSDELTEKLTNWFMDKMEDRTKIHLSDVCHCPMKCWNRLIGLEGLPPNNTGVGKMTIGIIGQRIFQMLYPEEWSEYEPDDSMPSHIDIYVQEDDRPHFPVEIKCSARSIYRGTDIGKSWLLQATGYMAKTMENEGKFLIFNTINARLNSFRLVMTDEELVERNKEIDDIRDQIRTAVDRKDPNLLDIWEDECRYCPYRDTRSRSKYELGKGCLRYKGNLPSQTELSEFFDGLSQG